MNGYIINIKESDIVKKADFGHFTITKTAEEIIFSNYTGYMVICKPYVAVPQGGVGKNSLYAWLDFVIEMYDSLKDKKDEINPSLGVKNIDFLFSLEIITEANMTHPCVAFVDSEHASKEAIRHMDWMDEHLKKLKEVMDTTPPDEDEKANVEEFYRKEMQETIENMAKDGR